MSDFGYVSGGGELWDEVNRLSDKLSGRIDSVETNVANQDKGTVAYKAVTQNSFVLDPGVAAVVGVNFAGAVTITLEDPAAPVKLVIKDESGSASSNNITVSATIDGGSSATISTDYGALRLYYSGSSWFTY